MPKKFTDADALLSYLVDRLEAGVSGPLAYPDHDGFASITEADAFARRLAEVRSAGAVHIEMARGRRVGEVKFVRLSDPEKLYGVLGRTPSEAMSAKALESILSAGEFACELESEARNAAAAWSRNANWAGIRPGNVTAMRAVMKLAQAVLDGRHEGLDYRTFSRRVTGDSKALERLEAGVVKALRATALQLPASPPREALDSLGLGKVSPPLLVSGPVTLGGTAIPSSMPYLGCSPRSVGEIGFLRTPSYLLTIENYASFIRYAAEADAEKQGIAIYVGGYPAAGIQKALADVGSRLPPEVPAYHWSDIDPDGIGIFIVVEKAIGRRLRPHLMDVAVAEKHGAVPESPSSRVPRAEGSLVEELAAYLTRPGAKYLEQEELDPVIPPVT